MSGRTKPFNEKVGNDHSIPEDVANENNLRNCSWYAFMQWACDNLFDQGMSPQYDIKGTIRVVIG
ncbi:hypothetical protein T01_6197 [Trichinella spiralis]|uniref:Uncharacterized protein n=1 Tax=Trichinella spiralis TaxID=6334 RepID=A0A0V1B0X3_TRISP|nr:hypothetical protein T01_6197 [Trichinella spiralis]